MPLPFGGRERRMKRIAIAAALLGSALVGATVGFTFGEWIEDTIYAFKHGHGWA
jgi:hypothetical protein